MAAATVAPILATNTIASATTAGECSWCCCGSTVRGRVYCFCWPSSLNLEEPNQSWPNLFFHGKDCIWRYMSRLQERNYWVLQGGSLVWGFCPLWDVDTLAWEGSKERSPVKFGFFPQVLYLTPKRLQAPLLPWQCPHILPMLQLSRPQTSQLVSDFTSQKSVWLVLQFFSVCWKCLFMLAN